MQNQLTTNRSIEIEMCLMLNCSVENYREIIYKYGCIYLQWYMPVDERLRDKLSSSKLFWAWFRLIWFDMDKNMLDEEEFQFESIKERRKTFKKVHRARDLAATHKPPHWIVNTLNKKEATHE